MVSSLKDIKKIAKASRGLMADYFAFSPKGQLKDSLPPPDAIYDLKTLMEDSTFNSEVNVIVDKIMRGGFVIYRLKEDGTMERDPEREKELKRKYRFNSVLRQIFLNNLIYRNSFVEIEWKGGYPKKFHLLETPEMRIRSTPHGEILGYVQEHNAGMFKSDSGKIVAFTPQEVVHIAPSKLSTNVWGFIDTRSIKDIVTAKRYLEAYIFELFKDNKFRDAFFIKDAASVDQVENVIETIKQGRLYPEKDLVFEGEIEQKQLRTTDIIKDLTELWNHYREAIREFLRVPPLMAGDVGQSNKSTGEFQVRYAFENTIRSWQDIVADEVNYELFKMMGWGQYRIKFPITDKPTIDTILKQAVNLQGLGYDRDTLHQFLIENDVVLPSIAKFNEIPEMGEEGANQEFANMNAPSRQPSDKRMDEQGSSDNVTTRDEQIVGKAKIGNPNDYAKVLK